MLIEYVTIYMKALSAFGEMPPLAVLMSLANIKGMRLLQDFIENSYMEDMPFRYLTDDTLEFDDVMFEKAPSEPEECANMLLPMLRHFANAAGLPGPPNFDSAGNYKSPR
jgi:hypothetical protein